MGRVARRPACDSPVTLTDFKTLARARLPASVFDYLECGACDEITRRANRRDLSAIRLVPRCLRDVSTPDLSQCLLGQFCSVPVGFSPTAFHRLVHEEGE